MWHKILACGLYAMYAAGAGCSLPSSSRVKAQCDNMLQIVFHRHVTAASQQWLLLLLVLLICSGTTQAAARGGQQGHRLQRPQHAEHTLDGQPLSGRGGFAGGRTLLQGEPTPLRSTAEKVRNLYITICEESHQQCSPRIERFAGAYWEIECCQQFYL